eukprot:1194876-Prorocentrum_minimum.AAC.3
MAEANVKPVAGESPITGSSTTKPPLVQSTLDVPPSLTCASLLGDRMDNLSSPALRRLPIPPSNSTNFQDRVTTSACNTPVAQVLHPLPAHAAEIRLVGEIVLIVHMAAALRLKFEANGGGVLPLQLCNALP